MINLPKRPEGGFLKAEKDEQAITFKKPFKTLGDLYTGNAQEKQGAILIDIHLAANAVGATCTARPEDTEIATDPIKPQTHRQSRRLWRFGGMMPN